MSEKIYAFLIRLFPVHFRKTYGSDALQLFRDRSSAEKGFWPGLRLWFDLLADLAVSIPREYRQAEPALLHASALHRFDGIPEFQLLETESPRPSTLISGTILSLATFAAVSILIVHGGSNRPAPFWNSHTSHPNSALSSTSRISSPQPSGNGQEKIMNPDGPTREIGSLETDNAQPARITSMHKSLPANGVLIQSSQTSSQTQTEQPNASAAQASTQQHPTQPPTGNARDKITASNHPATEIGTPKKGDAQPVTTTTKDASQAGNAVATQSNQAQTAQPVPHDATAAMMHAFDTHNIVMFGENHGVKQEYEWLDKLVSTPEFADRVDDIVVEFGNSLYQKSVDRYIAGENVPLEQVQKAWRNMIGAVGPPSPVYGQFYKAVRDANLKRRGKHPMRLVLGDPYGDWDKIKDAEDLGPYVANRDQWYAQVVKDEVLAKNHRALLIMGAGHFLRRNGPGLVEREIRAAGANPYLVVFGTNAVSGYDDLDARFGSWPRPAIVPLSGNWVGGLPAVAVTTGGMAPATPLKLADAADALLYLAPRDALTQVNVPHSELDGTAYEKELNRRVMIQTGHPMGSLPSDAESPFFQRPLPQMNAGGQHGPPPPPRSMHDRLPPRPPSR